MYKKEESVTERLAQISRFRSIEAYDQALLLCDALIQEMPDCYSAYRVKSRICYELGLYKKAFYEIARFIELFPNDLGAYLERAVWFLERGKDACAIDDLSFLIGSGEEYFLAMAHFYRAVAYMNLEENDSALADCLQLPEDFNFYVKTYRHGGRMLSRHELVRCLTG